MAACAQDLKNCLFKGDNNAWWVGGESIGTGGWAVTRLDFRSADPANIPARPTITYVGSSSYVVTDLIFRSSPFSDPQGVGTFAAMQWRVAEITPTNTPVSNPSELKFEWDAVWDSGVRTAVTNLVRVPPTSVVPGRVHRARVRHKDISGRWSNWSQPVQFVHQHKHHPLRPRQSAPGGWQPGRHHVAAPTDHRRVDIDQHLHAELLVS